MKAWGSKKVFRGDEIPPLEPWNISEFHGPSVQRPFLREIVPEPVTAHAPEPVEVPATVESTPVAPPPPPQPVAPTQQELDALRTAAREEGYRAGFEQGKADGHAEGLAEGRSAGHAEGLASGTEAGERAARELLQSDIDQLRALVGNVQETVSGFEDALAAPVADLALTVAKQMVRGAYAEVPDRILSLVREALGGSPELQGPVRLEMNPEDALLCQTHLLTEAAAGGWRFEANPDIARGGCRISNATLEIDLTLPTRWRRIVDAMGRRNEWASDDGQ